MLESGRIRLVRPSAVIITHFQCMSRKTLENCIHKDHPRNVGGIHNLKFQKLTQNSEVDPAAADMECVRTSIVHRTTTSMHAMGAIIATNTLEHIG